MTFAVFIVLVLGVFIALLNVLPTAAALGFSFQPAVATIAGYMMAWNFMFPIAELFTFLKLFIALEIGIWVWKVSIGTIKFIRGHSDGA